MNKTININLGGIFFHIDENAFKKLKHYLDAIGNSLNDDPKGKEEIINDIEQRISELLLEKRSDEKQVINETNIDEVIAVMGQPEDYAYDDELFNEPKTYQGSSKKLYRDGKDKILGGVSSGLGHYLGIDTAWIRIFWIIITLLYGTGVLAYIVLWIILPEATTTAEELEMKGQAVNIDNIEKKIKEEYTKIEDKVRNADYSQVKTGFQDFIETIGRIFVAFFKVFGKFIGVLLLIIASTTLIALVLGLFSWGSVEILGFSDQFVHLPPFFESSMIPIWLLTLLMFFAFIIPFIFLFILGINILSGDKKSLGITGNLALVGIWLIALFGLIFVGIEHTSRFSTKASVSTTYDYNVETNDTLRVVMVGNDKIANRKSLYRSRNLEYVEDDLGNEKLFSSYVHVDIRRSSTDKTMVKVLKSGKAFNTKKAKENASLIEYNFKENNNTFNFDAYFLLPNELEKIRPKINIIAYVPEGVYVYLDNTTKSFLNDISNTQNIYDSDMADHLFYMSSQGFECADCDEEESDDKLNLDINKEGVKLIINNGNDQAKVKIDENGIEVK